MDTYELEQVLMTVGAIYEVRKPGSPEVLYTVKGELMAASPKFRLIEGKDGGQCGQLVGDMLKRNYELKIGDDVAATVSFPTVALTNKMTLRLDGKEYKADGGIFKDVFQCKGEDGKVILEVAKRMTVTDRFVVQLDSRVPAPVAFLSAVAIHSRFFDIL